MNGEDYFDAGASLGGRCWARTRSHARVVEMALETLGQSPHDRKSETYVNVVRPREYEALDAAVRENVECGNSTIATAPYLRELASA